MKDNVIFWRDWDEAIRTLPDKDQAEAYHAVLDYAMNDTPYTGQSIGIKMLMQFLKPRIDEQIERYNKVCERNRENGQKGGRPRNPEKPSETQENPLGLSGSELEPSETQENPIKDKGYKDKGYKDKGYKDKGYKDKGYKDKGKKKKDIIIPIPTIEEVEEYIKTKGYDIDARAFWAYYDAREWLKNGEPIKNWHLQVATWVNNSNRYNNQDNGISKRTRANQRGESPITDWQNVTEDDMQF